MFVRNVEELRLTPTDHRTIGDLGMSSVVLIPVMSSPAVPLGAVCAYWLVGRSSWDSGSREAVCSWVLDAARHDAEPSPGSTATSARPVAVDLTPRWRRRAGHR